MIKINRNNILLIINDLTVIAVSSFLSILIKYDFKIPSDFIQTISPALITLCFLVKIFLVLCFISLQGYVQIH